MKKLKLLLWEIIFLLAVTSCQVIYDDPSIQQDKTILTVTGRVTNGPGPYYIRLSNALPFNTQYTTLAKDIAVMGAKVTIEDNAGNSEVLSEQATGIYATSANGLQGVVGRTYTLTIVTKAGDTYKSSPCFMNESLPIDSVYYEAATNQTLNTITSELNTESGVNVYADLTSIKKQSVYCKFETRIIREIYGNEYPNGPHEPEVRVYCWTVSQLEEIPVLAANITQANTMIRKQSLGFMAKDEISNNPVKFESFIMIGRVVSCYSYSLSEEAYLYYTHLREQLTAENKLFDPISTNLISNIKCENDASKKVFGLFEVSGKSAKHSFLRYNMGDMLIHSKNVDDSPDNVINGVSRDHPPDYDSIPVFWQQM